MGFYTVTTTGFGSSLISSSCESWFDFGVFYFGSLSFFFPFLRELWLSNDFLEYYGLSSLMLFNFITDNTNNL
jgi:hypothetical protein